MKYRYLVFFSLLMATVYGSDLEQAIPESAFMIDTIKAVVFGQAGIQVIAHSDVQRSSLTGAPQTLDDIIFERLVYLDAQKYQIVPDEDAVDKYLAMVQKENNITLDQLKDIFAAAGYTYDEGRQQFRMLQTVNSMLSFKIHSQVIVPRAQVEAYYHEHPEVEEAEYYLQYGFMPYAEKRDAQERAFQHMARTGKEMHGIAWYDPFWIKQSEIVEDKLFILDMTVGGISQPIDRGDGYEIYRLLDKRAEKVPTLDDRYHEIANILRRPVFEELLEKYKKSLFDSVSILYF